MSADPDADVLPFVAVATSGRFPRQPQPKRQRLLLRHIDRPQHTREGPFMFVLILGSSLGKYSDKAFQAQGVSDLLPFIRRRRANIGLGQRCVHDDPAQPVHLLGLAVVQMWNLLEKVDEVVNRTIVAADDRAVFGQCLKRAHRRSTNLGMNDMTIIAAALAQEPHVRIPDDVRVSVSSNKFVHTFDLPSLQAFMDQSASKFIESRLLSHVDLQGDTLPSPDVSACPMSFNEVRQRWAPRISETMIGRILGLHYWSDLAELMVRGAWFGDLQAVTPRSQHPGIVFNRPPPSVVAQYLKAIAASKLSPVMPQKHDLEHAANYPQSLQPLGHGVDVKFKKWDAMHMLSALTAIKQSASVHLDLEVDAASKLEFMFPNCHEEMFSKLKDTGFETPKAKSLERGRVRLDVVAMLMHRQRHRELQPLATTVGADASPKGGHELLAIVERNSYVRGQVEAHRGPQLTMSYGCTGLLFKVVCFLWYCFLEHGPTIENVRFFLAQVTAVLTDQGSEFGICNFPDILDVWWASTFNGDVARAAAAFNHSAYLFPNALQVVGWNHVIAGLLKCCCSCMRFVAEYLRLGKPLCAWLRVGAHRERIMDRLKSAGKSWASIKHLS
jgi:hypothetical protein